MRKKKKQHYVPQFLLRHFSTDEGRKFINAYQPDQLRGISNCSIKTQAQEKNFYGADGEMEGLLERLENLAAPVVLKILRTHELPARDTIDYDNLFVFSFLQSERTRGAVDEMHEALDSLLQRIIEPDAKLGSKDEKHLLRSENPAAHIVSIAAQVIWQAYDLKLGLLVNESNRKFITSDVCTVRCNQFFEKRDHPGEQLGFASKGLQLFVPLSPTVMLIFYDSWAYKVGNRKDKVIKVKNCNDVDQLNMLQVVNCGQVCFHNNDIAPIYLRQLSKRSARFRLEDRSVTTSFIEEPNENGQTSALHLTRKKARKSGLELSFIKEPQRAKSCKLTNHVAQLRDESLRDRQRHAPKGSQSGERS